MRDVLMFFNYEIHNVNLFPGTSVPNIKSSSLYIYTFTHKIMYNCILLFGGCDTAGGLLKCLINIDNVLNIVHRFFSFKNKHFDY
jgi:hypothetical protein